MRLPAVRTGQPLHRRAMLAIMRLVEGEPQDILKMLFYRPSYFSRPFLHLTHLAMRGESGWRVGERELFAAHVSQANGCRFCAVSHAETARKSLPAGLADAALADPEKAALDERARATLAFVKKLAREPAAIGPADVDALRKLGIDDEAIEDAIHVTTAFCTINRLADALDFQIPDSKSIEKGGRMLLTLGYGPLAPAGPRGWAWTARRRSHRG